MFFRDGQRRIDYILAYHDTDDIELISWRDKFEENLKKEGLELETEHKKDSQDGKTHFVKVHAPWDVLTRVAELTKMKMPIKEYDTNLYDTGCLSKLPNPMLIEDGVIPEEPEYFTADFSRERMKMFIIEDQNTFFTNAQRSFIVYELLLRTRYTETSDKFGIDRLIRHAAYSAAFPLHEFISFIQGISIGIYLQLLYETWARPGRWLYFQPTDLVRKYYGEKVGIYFTWLGFYTTMLIPASILGVIVFIYGCATLFKNPPSEEVCDESGAGNLTMCPLCDRHCSYWKLKTSCMYSRLTYLFDNGGTVFFACFMAIWATLFLEFWKRKQAELQYDWDVADFDYEEHVRPEFEARCKKRRLNPVTQMMEPFMPIYSRIPRWCTSFSVVLFMICCVICAVFGVIMYRVVVVTLLYSVPNPYVQQFASITTSCTAAVISLIIIMLLNRLYEKVALFLTELERPRTESEYEDSYTFKMFLFQFINYYSSLFYIAFFKGRLAGRPGDYDYSLGYRAEECDPAGCLIELCIQLGIVMIGKQAYNNFKEITLPKIMNWMRSRGAKKNETEENLYTRWEQDYDLNAVPLMGLFDEYLEMVIQYGFTTIFVAAFPLAPLCALINNIIEIRLDAYKLTTQMRRSVALRAQDIGIWLNILQGITFMAVLTNAFIIAWTSDFVPKLVYRYTQEPGTLDGYVNQSLSFFDVKDFQERSIPKNNASELFGDVTYCRYKDQREPPWSPNRYDYTSTHWHTFCAQLAFVIIFEHLVFFLTWLVAYLVPDVPARIRMLMLREVYLAKEAKYDASFSTLHSDRRQESLDKTV
ncbi:hypothetical protein CAPTEDRAFT_153854 [Capitella teleta]|uniref:Anoctamin n=1 Tax=Capitella teleta TaxID=283909 RepID=R7UV80_CAPTE|nr:hypothetical protein CAPTEDRAFT_153854 [Capitella teleta]|eukprot:ELU07311.1 hypothetical protein CAPTEDRAFT_153854 [Capitella teleta]